MFFVLLAVIVVGIVVQSRKQIGVESFDGDVGAVESENDRVIDELERKRMRKLVCEGYEREDEDKLMRELHRNMWQRGSNRIDDVANFTAKVVGAEIQVDTEKAQKRLMKAAREEALKK